MRFSSFGFLGKGTLCAAATMAAVIFAGCSDDPGLQERLNRLQAEMQEKDRQLQESQSALEKTKSELKSARAASATKPMAADTPAPTTAPAATPQFLPREKVEENYATASKAMQKRVASELRNYTVENCTQFPVLMPSDEFPYHSKIGLTFRSDGGRSYRLEFPVSADTTGKWTFPNSVDIANALAENHQPDQPTNTTASNPTPVPTPTSTPRVAQNNPTPAPTTSRTSNPTGPDLVPGQNATETRTIDWGGARSTNNNRASQSPSTAKNQPPVQQPTPIREVQQPTPVREVQQPTPQASKPPTQPMQSDRDVKIHW